MNDQRLLWHYEALVSLTMHAPGVVHVTYRHDDDCPCRSGYLPLPCCECHPIMEVNGAPYLIDDAGNVLLLEHK